MKQWTAFMVVIALVVSIPTGLLAWGAITHTYFATELGARWGNQNLQEIYGSTLPDVFNLMYDSPYKEYLWTQTHYEFMKFAGEASGRSTKAAAYGFVSHNDDWGADKTAHHSAMTNPGEGYVITKANAIVPALVPRLIDVLTDAGVQDPATVAQELAPALGENFIETAVDILVKRNEDPLAGFRLAVAAQLRDIRVPFMLSRAYARDLAAEFGISRFMAGLIIIRAEYEYRDLMRLYGGVFLKSEDEIIELLAEQGAVLAQTLLKAETGCDVVVPAAPLADFMRNVAIPAVEPDYGAEIAATLAYLQTAMPAHGFTASAGEITASGKGSMEIPEATGGTLALNQNHPNPFNPSTTISFHLPEESHVTLSVFNAEGRRIRTLVDGVLRGGYRQSMWDGADSRGNPVASGVYFYSLKAGGKILTKKMVLVR
jgi:hypothetical protein